MGKYIATEVATGRIVEVGDTVTSFRGEPGVFQGVTRGPDVSGPYRSNKVQVDGAEFYSTVWGLSIS